MATLLYKEPVETLLGPSPRVESIKERFIAITPEISIERAKLITESYKETEAEPIHIRRAKALEKILAGMPIFVGKDELIVGNSVRGALVVTCLTSLR